MKKDLQCHIDVPEWYRAIARYGLETLLFPLGIEPVWADRLDVTRPWVYYGTGKPPDSGPGLSIPLNTNTLDLFQEKRLLDPAGVIWTETPDGAFPQLFPYDPDSFPFPGKRATPKWDIVAATFYWLSGWHEAYSVVRDRHGRVPFKRSLPEVLGVVDVPVVDVYRECFSRWLGDIGVAASRRSWGNHTWATCVTHDIDYDRKWRPGILYRDIISRAGGAPAERLAHLGRAVTAIGRRRDPYRISALTLVSEEAKRSISPTLFVKTAAHGPYDVSYRLRSNWMQKLELETKAASGVFALHTSYFGSVHEGYLVEEISRFEDRFGEPPAAIRSHYLRFDPDRHPGTLAKVGLLADSTLAFAEREGFRRGTCQPYRLFDLRSNTTTDVWEVPLTVMDSSLFNYRYLDARQAIEVTKRTLETCRRYRGVCVLLFHNMTYDTELPAWREHFEDTIETVGSSDALTDTIPRSLTAWLNDG